MKNNQESKSFWKGKGFYLALTLVIAGAATAACGFLPPDAFPAFIVLVAVMAVACAWFNGPLITLV